MSRFLFTWEIGSGMGHTVPLAQVAEPLVARGHEVHFALRELTSARVALGALADAPNVRLWQAPIWQLKMQGLPVPLSYAELLFRAGYLDAGRLRGLVQGWCSLIDTIQPDLLLADHSPTALLAARGRPLRRALIGSGFFQPPAVAPMPGFGDQPVPPKRLADAERLAVMTCNEVLRAQGQTPLVRLHELLDADELFLVTWPELDHYSTGPQGRPAGPCGVRYWGPLQAREDGTTPVWPAGEGPKLLAYLRADYKALDSVLQQLAQAPFRTLAYVVGMGGAVQQRAQSARLAFCEKPFAMRDALAQADAVLCHSGAGTISAALQAGVPLLLLPTHAEQMLLARRVAATGAGKALSEADVPQRLRSWLAEGVASPGLKQQARALAARHPPSEFGRVAERVAERCEALAAAL
jgi:hypothetical protein